MALALGELEAADLVTTSERRVPGLVRRTVHVRTTAGEEVLAAGVTGGDDGDFESTFDAGSSGGSGDDGGADGGGDGGGS